MNAFCAKRANIVSTYFVALLTENILKQSYYASFSEFFLTSSLRGLKVAILGTKISTDNRP
jgi:hypothetical protein